MGRAGTAANMVQPTAPSPSTLLEKFSDFGQDLEYGLVKRDNHINQNREMGTFTAFRSAADPKHYAFIIP